MKPLLGIFTILFTLIFSSASFAEWTDVGRSVDGDTFYIDFERIRENDDYVYYWELQSLSKPDTDGDFSYKWYYQGDCNLFRLKLLKGSYHKDPMGIGEGIDGSAPDKWEYPPPNSMWENSLNLVCSR